MNVERYDHPWQIAQLTGLADDVDRVLRSGSYVLGAEVREFEAAFAAHTGTDYAVGVNSGTDALVLALRALGIGPGDEVITAANTFHATVLAIFAVGALPRLVDCRPDDWLIDLDAVADAINERTAAILPVHLFGRAVLMAPLLELARRHGLAVVEDCAQAVGARDDGQRVGSLSDAGCFSFHPSKNLSAAGDGGALTTNREDVAEACRQMRSLGQAGQNHHVVRGVNSKLDELQALLLRRKLPLVDGWNERRRAVAARYEARLRGTGVEPAPLVEDERHVYHLFQVEVADRDGLLAGLRDAGVDAVVRYPTPPHRQPAFAGALEGQGPFPAAERQAAATLCLPMRASLTVEEVDYVCETVTRLASPVAGGSRS